MHVALLLLLAGCAGAATEPPRQTGALPQATELPAATGLPVTTELPAATELPVATALPERSVTGMPGPVDAPVADVTAVRVSGDPGAYQFSVEISSPDTGCEQFADWWEIVTEDGQLLYRRVLLHSHVTEQPFVRSGGPVDVDEDTVVIVRAHMNNGGYGGQAFRGTAGGGLEPVELAREFAADLEETPPLPDGCGF